MSTSCTSSVLLIPTFVHWRGNDLLCVEIPQYPILLWQLYLFRWVNSWESQFLRWFSDVSTKPKETADNYTLWFQEEKNGYFPFFPLLFRYRIQGLPIGKKNESRQIFQFHFKIHFCNSSFLGFVHNIAKRKKKPHKQTI